MILGGRLVFFSQILMAFIFAIFALVQINDNDWFLWMPVYFLVFVLTIINLKKKGSVSFFVIAAVFYFAAAIYLRPSSFNHWLDNEVAREFFGLIICSTWLFIVSLQNYFRKFCKF